MTMLTSLGLLIALQFHSSPSAILTSKNHQWVLEVSAGGRTEELRAGYNGKADRGDKVSPNTVLKYHGFTFRGDGSRVSNKATGAMCAPFGVDTNSWGAGVVAHGKMVWIYSQADYDTSFDPIVASYAFVMTEKDGVPIVQRIVPLKGMSGYGNLMSRRYKDWLVVYSEPNGARTMGILNLKTLEFRTIVNASPSQLNHGHTPDTGYYAVCSNGNMYTSDSGYLKAWDWTKLKWIAVRKLKEQNWISGYALDHDDLLCGLDSIALAHRGAVYQLPDFMDRELFISPSVGIGVVEGVNSGNPHGFLLSPKDLSILCLISFEKNVPN